MLKKLTFYHLIPISISLLAVFLILNLKINPENNELIISGDQTKVSGKYGNFLAGDSTEINYLSGLENKNQFTLFGSSELTDSKYCSYNFFPDSMDIQMLGIGHAYHQSLSILIELMAANEYLDEQTKICIIISPGWFGTAGTNTESFVEFARPNFLNKILIDSTIPSEFKNAIGKYIHENESDFEGLPPSFKLLKNHYEKERLTGLAKSYADMISYCEKKLSSIYNPTKITYQINDKIKSNKKRWAGSFDTLSNRLQSDFVNNITTNNIYVYDEYYTKYLDKEGTGFEKNKVSKIDSNNNIEYEQFKTLMKYIAYKNIDASFVIIPLNPYCYNYLDYNDSFFNALTTNIEKEGFPCYNLYTSDTSVYQKGILKDVMHLSDFGWLKVNSFIYENYYEKFH